MFPVITLQNLLTYDSTLFDNQFILPAGASTDIAIETIVAEYGEMQLLWPDWDTMHHMIGSWSRKYARNFERLWKVFNQEYNALWNKDGTYTEVRTPDLTRDSSGTNQSSSQSSNSVEGKSDRQAFNSAQYEPVTRDTSTGNGTSSGSATVNNIEHTTGTETVTRTESGNIGVTKSQEMLEDEFQLWMRVNFYEAVAKRFALDFCVMVY